MRLLIQRVDRASVIINGQTTASIGRGFLVLCGFKKGDSPAHIRKMANKCLNLRIFEDSQRKMNLSLIDIKGEILAVSQFTLYADCRQGRRPSFEEAMLPDEAGPSYSFLIEELLQSGLRIETGVFGAKMRVELT
ncbi:MAG: D-aminoacyl-tRNA deacylase, partial [candidate division Zixibacteria bacterium]|nr:D-aminoacyl-tRNA deacylase [candidate division Zixibacteria bacterium]